MTTTPNGPGPDAEDSRPAATSEDDDAQGVEIGMSPGEGSTFEPEEDPEGHS